MVHLMMKHCCETVFRLPPFFIVPFLFLFLLILLSLAPPVPGTISAVTHTGV